MSEADYREAEDDEDQSARQVGGTAYSILIFMLVSFSTSFISSSIVHSRPQISSAFVGQASGFFPHTPLTTQELQAMQRLRRKTICGSELHDSGLWHHTQRSGHPFRKIVVRMPGPSLMAYRLMSKMLHLIIFGSCDNLVLQLWGHVIEIVAVASHSHQ